MVTGVVVFLELGGAIGWAWRRGGLSAGYGIAVNYFGRTVARWPKRL